MTKIKFPTAPEVCLDCSAGNHIMHVITELAEFSIAEVKTTQLLQITGYAADELFLEDLLRVLHLEYGRMQVSCLAYNPTLNARCELSDHHAGPHSLSLHTTCTWSDAACAKLDSPPKELK